MHKIEHDSAIDEYLSIFGGDHAQDYLCKGTILIGNAEMEGLDYDYEELTEILDDDYVAPEYFYCNRTSAIIEELEDVISKIRNDDVLMKVYISDILNRLDDVSRYFYPKSFDPPIYYDTAKLLRNPKQIEQPCKPLLEALSAKAEELAEEHFKDEEINQREYSKYAEDQYTRLVNEHVISVSSSDITAITKIFEGIEHFALILEGVLLQYETKYDLFDYQRMFNIFIRKRIKFYEFCNYFQWSRGLAKYNMLKKYPCNDEDFSGVDIQGPKSEPRCFNYKGEYIGKSESTSKDEIATTMDTPVLFGQLLDQACQALEKIEYVEKGEDGVGWIFKANDDLYAYLALTLAKRCYAEKIPWDYMMSKVSTKNTKAYLKKQASSYRKGKKPKSYAKFEDALKGIKLK